MTTPSKRKGDAAELEIARILANQLGFNVKRMLGAGRTEDVGDLHGIPQVTAQVKNYPHAIVTAINDGLHDLERQQVQAGSLFGVVFVRRPGGRWIAVQDVPGWCTMYRETRGRGEVLGEPADPSWGERWQSAKDAEWRRQLDAERALADDLAAVLANILAGMWDALHANQHGDAALACYWKTRGQ